MSELEASLAGVLGQVSRQTCQAEDRLTWLEARLEQTLPLAQLFDQCQRDANTWLSEAEVSADLLDQGEFTSSGEDASETTARQRQGALKVLHTYKISSLMPYQKYGIAGS
ncbi:unnamed protein product [Protopolystoma xenopodis]|uniref:Uncharacterized protein n=1 Tax=Protopolystoma xenopodis TaxID=117903 RepID=A0A3S5FCU3_9PLAT|nr:unnamed protein product [Protopolystoma xenopodis]